MIPLNSVITDQLTVPNQTRWYKITPEVGGNFQFQLSNLPAGCIYSSGLYDDSGELIAMGESSAGDEQMIDKYRLTLYDYYIQVTANGNGSEDAFSLSTIYEPLDDGETVPARILAGAINSVNYEPDPDNPEQGLPAFTPVDGTVQSKTFEDFGPELSLNANDESKIGTGILASDVTRIRNSEPLVKNGRLNTTDDPGGRKLKIYNIPLERNDKITCSVSMSIGLEYMGVALGKIGSSVGEGTTVNLDRVKRVGYCEFKVTTPGTYLIIVFPHGKPLRDDFSLSIYVTNENPTYEHNYMYTSADKNAVINDHLGNQSRRAASITGLSIDSPVDEDFYCIDVRAGDKISAVLSMNPGYNDRLQIHRLSLQYLVDESPDPSDSNWTNYIMRVFEFENVFHAKNIDDGTYNSKMEKYLSMIAPITGKMYLTVKSANGSWGYASKNKYSLKATVVRPDENADPNEIRGSGTTNDFFEINGNNSVLPTINLNESKRGAIDNELDVDWFKITPTASNSIKPKLTANAGGTNFQMVICNKNGNGIESFSSDISYPAKANETYYIGVYTNNWIPSENHAYTLKIQSGAEETLSVNSSSVKYNGTKGPMLGYDNELKFLLRKNSTGSNNYYVEPAVGWSEQELFSKKRIPVTLSGANYKEVAISPIELTGGGKPTLYTKIRVYNAEGTTLLWESQVYSHTRSNAIMPANLELKKQPGGSMMYVNNPEKLSDYDVIRADKDDETLNYLLFQQADVTGENTLYATHSANGINATFSEARLKGGFYYDIDFYNPSSNSIAVWVTKRPNAFSVNNYENLSRNEEWLWEEAADHTINIPPGEHRLLFQDLMEQDSLWTATRNGVDDTFFIGLYANFYVENGKKVTVSTLAAYDQQYLRLFGNASGLKSGSPNGVTVAKGDMRFDSPSETDLSMKIKGIDRGLNGGVITELSYIFDDSTPNDATVPLEAKFEADTFYGNPGLKSPQETWYTNINPINDNYFARYSTPVSGLEEYQYKDGYGNWDFGYDRLNGLAIDYVPKPGWFQSEEEAWVESWKGNSDSAQNPPLNNTIISYFKDAGRYGSGTTKPSEINFAPDSAKATTWDRAVINCSGWGIKQTTKIKLQNNGDNANTFWYNLHSPGIVSYCIKVTDEYGNIVNNNGRDWFEVGSYIYGGDLNLLGYGVQIPGGHTYDVTVTVLCGVNMTGYHHSIGLGNNPQLS